MLGFDDGGAFFSGPAALPMWPECAPPERPEGPSSRLAREALAYAGSLPVSDARRLSARLYTYNSIPATARWKAALCSAEAVADFLGLGPRGPNSDALANLGYEELDHPQWFAWTRRAATLDNLRWKLYVSPRPEHLAAVLGRAIPLLGELGAGSLKIGRTAQNLLRADKFIVYLESAPALERLAAALRHELSGTPVQGVPFTCACGDDALLSWGVDPPRSLCLAGWAQAESWRAWIANRLAIALLQARAARSSEPWRFALARLAAEGIDPVRWAPGPELWAED